LKRTTIVRGSIQPMTICRHMIMNKSGLKLLKKVSGKALPFQRNLV
jgi:hypothetical protein